MMEPNEHGVFANPLPQIKLHGKQWSIEIAAVLWRGRWFYGAHVQYGRCQVGAGGFAWPASMRRESYIDVGSALDTARQEIVKRLSPDGSMEKTVKTAVKEARIALERVPILRQAMLPGLGDQ